MLLIAAALLVLWLAIVTVTIAACITAKGGDAQLEPIVLEATPQRVAVRA